MKTEIKIIYILLLVSIGITIGILFSHLNEIDFKFEIDILSIIALLISSFFAIFAGFKLPKILEANKFEKELILERIKPILTGLNVLKESILNNSKPKEEVTKIFKKISQSITEIEELNKLITYCDIKEIKSIRSLSISLKKNMTDSSVKEGVYAYTKDSSKNSLSFIKLIEKKLIKLILERKGN